MVVRRQEFYILLAKPVLSEDFLGDFVVDVSDFIFYICLQYTGVLESKGIGIQ